MTLKEFIAKYEGVSDVGNTPENKGECVGLVMVYIESVPKLSHIWGHARDIYNNAPISEWIKIENEPSAYPIKGDIICWDDKVGDGDGHIAIVVSSDEDADTVTVFEQNNPGNVPGTDPEITTYSIWYGITGWLRAKNTVTDTTLGVDVSVYQGDINYSELKNDAQFIIIKATEGYGFEDDKFARNQVEARKSGMVVGYYHFARPDLDNSPEDEAQWFLDTVSPEKGELLCLDFEVPCSTAVGWCKEWLDYVSSKLDGYKPFIYLNQSQTTQYDWKAVVDADYGLWLAKYDFDPTAPAPITPWPVVAMRQYSNNEEVAGIAGVVDGNVFYGSRDQLELYGIQNTVNDECEARIEALEGELNDMRLSRNKHRTESRKLNKEVEKLTISLEELSMDIESFRKKIEDLQGIIGTNRTPLSSYTWMERFKSLFL